MTTNQTAARNPVKFAYWVPNVSGGLVVSKIEQRTHWDLEYNVKSAQIAEAAGFDYALSQIRFTAGYGAEYQHESVSFSQALLQATKDLKVLAAILPGPWHPAVVAKQLATIDHITNGRVAINVVSGWFKGEFQAIGEPWLEHDERYRRLEEFIRALKGIWTQDNFTLPGTFTAFATTRCGPNPYRSRTPRSSKAVAHAARVTWPRASRIGISPTATAPRKSPSRFRTFAAKRRVTVEIRATPRSV